jgi:site-specific DNA recombinase
MHIEDGALRERLIGLKLQRDETAKDIGDVQKRLSSAEPIITPEKINRIALLLRDKLHNGPSESGRPLLACLWTTSITDEEIRISGPKAVLARPALDGMEQATPGVLSFVREWRTRRDSNPWPLPSEGSALSS